MSIHGFELSFPVFETKNFSGANKGEIERVKEEDNPLAAMIVKVHVCEGIPHDGIGVEIAKQICIGCTVTAPCLEYALTNRVEHGVWGGCSERQRRRILKERRAAVHAGRQKDDLVAVAA